MNDARESSPTALASLRRHWWAWLAVALAVVKLALLRAQPIYAIGNAIHDDQLFLKLARFIAEGQWLGPYDTLTLAKGPIYPAFVALNHYLGLPLRFTEELVYIGACALAVRALRPLALGGWARLLIFAVLLVNPLTYEGQDMTRILRQHLTVPFALIVCASLVALALRRDRTIAARLPWAITFGLTLGLFWLTREEGIWILGMTALLAVLAFGQIIIGPALARGRSLALLFVAFIAAAVPYVTVGTLNERHYGWFGPTEFHAQDFRDAYGALTRVQVGPHYPYIAVTREAREAIYQVSPAFAELRPHFEGKIGYGWADDISFKRDERQIAAGWFMWAFRDAVAAAGHYGSAREALAFYRRIADEVNRACNAGKIPARGPRSGFAPVWHPDHAAAIRDGAPRFLRGAFDFSNFEPTTPYSVGTDDEVRLFRDITHDRISHSPRATHIELPAQRELDGAKLNVLRWLGRNVGPWLTTLIVLAHLAALVRFVQLVRARRFSWPFAFAVGAWAGGAGELALNILVHTTAFPNFYTAAYAPALPLLLFFALLLVVDVARDWRAPAAAAFHRTLEFLARWPRSTWAVGIGFLVFGARLREVLFHASDVPLFDQWKVEAEQIIGPWLRGELSLSAFLQPHDGQIPLWTRVLAWFDAAVLGSWEPRLQMVINAALHATWAALLCDWLRRHLGALAALLATVLVLATACLPHAWENITWGFPSHVPLALLCVFVFVRGSFAHAIGSRGWWLAHAAGLAGLFTLGAFWTAPLLVALVNLWIAPRVRRDWLAPLGLAALGAGLMLVAQRSSSAEPAPGMHDFLHAWLHQLGWPLAIPAAAVLLNLPLLALALRLRNAHTASAFDRTLLVFGLWSIAQAAAFALARNGGGAEFASRHADLLALGVIANGVIALRLAGARWFWAPVALAWGAAVIFGLHALNTTGAVREFHEHSAGLAAFRENAVTAYVRHGNAKALTSEEGRHLIYSEPATITRLLDDRRFTALLPRRITLSGSAPNLGYLIAAQWKFWLALGGLLTITGLAGRPKATLAPALPDGASPLLPCALLGAGALGAFLLWPRPLAWEPIERRDALVYPANALRELRYEFVTATSYPVERLDGAANLSPESLRNLFVGTHLDGPDFTGTVRSQPFTLTSPWLVVPVAGFPSAPDNSLTLVVEGSSPGTADAAVRCDLPAPRDVGFWSIDVSAWRGRAARLVLRDSRTADQGWLAIAPPQPAESAAAAARRAAAWEAERSVAVRPTLLAVLAVALIGVAASLMSARRRA